MTDDIALEWAAGILGCEPGPEVRDLAAYKFLRRTLPEFLGSRGDPYANGYAAGFRDGLNATKE